MSRASFIAILVCLILGCSRSRPDPGAATLTIVNGDLSGSTTYQLMPAGQKLVESVLGRAPDSDVDGAIGLIPYGWLELEGKKYTVEPDELIFSGDNRTMIWRRKGIRKELVRNSQVKTK